MKKYPLKFFIVMLAVFFAASVHALNFSFMENSPAFYFNGDDNKLMESSAIKTLDSAKDGQKMTWKNPKTSAWGYFIPSASKAINGNVCRNLKSFTSAEGVTNEARYKLCKINKEWRIVD